MNAISLPEKSTCEGSAQISAHDEYSTFVSMHHTDAAGVVYVGSPLQWAQIGMENLFRSAGHPIEELATAPVHYPMVRQEINHFRKLRLGDSLSVRTYISRVGDRSFTVATEVINSSVVHVTVELTGVAVGRAGSKPSVEDWLRNLRRKAEEAGLGIDLKNRGKS